MFTSLAFNTFLPNGKTFGPGYPFMTSLISTQTGRFLSLPPKYKSTLVTKHHHLLLLRMFALKDQLDLVD